MDKKLHRRTVVDPAVADMLSDMEKRKRIASLSKSKQGKERRDAARHKVGLDLPLELHTALKTISDRERISISGLVTFFLYRGVVEHEAGKVELSPFKRLSRCARFEYVLDLTKLQEL